MMKKILLILLVLPVFLLSQKVSYDYFIEVNRIRLKPKNKEINTFYYFINSKTGDNLNVRRFEKKIMASLYDSDKALLHYFNIYEKEGVYNFIYADSYSYNTSNDSKKTEESSSQNIKVSELDDLNYLVELYAKPNSKKPTIKVEIEFEKSSFNYSKFSIDDQYGSLMNKMLQNKISEKECCRVIKQYKVHYRKSGYQFLYNIVNIEKTDLKIVLPEKLDIKSL